MAWFGPPPELDDVPRLPRTDTATFVREHLGRAPVLFTEVARAWADAERFSPGALARAAGRVQVTARQYDPASDVPFVEQTMVQTRRLPLSTWCAFVLGDEPGALPGAPYTWSLRESQEVLRRRPELLRWLPYGRVFPELGARFERFLWCGPDAYVTGLHTDEIDLNLLVVLWGEKDVVLFPPQEDDNLYPAPGEVQDGRYSRVNSYAPDLSRHPRFGAARGLQTRLAPGEMLFIPRGWWHATRSVGPSVSVNGSCRRLSQAQLSP